MYSIDTVLKGEDAVSKAGSKKYAAVLMDIDLGTGMSGLEAAKKIRKIPGCENIPIIAVTALAMRGDREKFLSEGCTHYLAKPYKKEELIRIIKEATEQPD
jgi:CheY-like chemotaxis protein